MHVHPRLVIPGLLLLIGACGSSHQSTEAASPLPRECVQFVRSYERFIAASAPQELARGRAAQTEGALRKQVKTDGVDAAASTCRSNLASIPAQIVKSEQEGDHESF